MVLYLQGQMTAVDDEGDAASWGLKGEQR